MSITPDAAAETSDRLLDGPAEAQGQRVEFKRFRDEEASRNLRRKVDSTSPMFHICSHGTRTRVDAQWR
jgi:hypothetical protein